MPLYKHGKIMCSIVRSTELRPPVVPLKPQRKWISDP